MVNKVILIGNLGADPELRSTGGGTAVSTIRLATTDRVKDKEGQWSDRTEWHNVVLWGRTAEVVHQYAKKGRQLYVEGRLQTRKWEDKDGGTRYATEVVAETVKLLGGKGDAGESGDRSARGGGYVRPESRPPASEPAAGGYGGGFDDDDVPFR